MKRKILIEKVKELRNNKAWSQSHLAEAAGLSTRTIQRLERTGNCSYETLLSIAAALDTDIEILTAPREENKFFKPVKFLTTAVISFSSLVALVTLITTSFLSEWEGGMYWNLGKLVFGTFILALGLLTLHQLWQEDTQAIRRNRVLSIAAILLIPLGSGVVIQTVGTAMQTGDIEWYIVLAGLVIICQGFLTLLSLWLKNNPALFVQGSLNF